MCVDCDRPTKTGRPSLPGSFQKESGCQDTRTTDTLILRLVPLNINSTANQQKSRQSIIDSDFQVSRVDSDSGIPFHDTPD